MTEELRFAAGDLIVRRHFQHDRLSRVWVGRVAAEDDLGTWMWVAKGSVYRDLGHADGRHLRQIPFGDWPSVPKAYDETPWSGADVLMLHPRTGDYSAWLFMEPGGGLRYWYINLELPAVRWRVDGLAGLDTIDYDLDVVVQPDLTWAWKDEAEFIERLAYPDVYWVSDGDAVRAEGWRIAKLAEAGEFPFDGTMTGYRPDPAWSLESVLPAGWDLPRAF